MIKPVITTLQQETGWQVYNKEAQALDFPDWYILWCAEEGLFYDGPLREEGYDY
jgi:hypothetical protein